MNVTSSLVQSMSYAQAWALLGSDAHSHSARETKNCAWGNARLFSAWS